MYADNPARAGFLSTPSARRATFRVSRQSGSKRISIHALREEGDEMPIYSIPGIENFYPRPPRGGRLPVFPEQTAGYKISIHALREEGDWHRSRPRLIKIISIHALREEGDYHPRTADRSPSDFYPRPPRGGRRRRTSSKILDARFLSTPSARRATSDGYKKTATVGFLSTPSARRATSCICSYSPAGHYFYPRPPRGGRPPRFANIGS